jgi:hypothetical protein
MLVEDRLRWRLGDCAEESQQEERSIRQMVLVLGGGD